MVIDRGLALHKMISEVPSCMNKSNLIYIYTHMCHRDCWLNLLLDRITKLGVMRAGLNGIRGRGTASDVDHTLTSVCLQ